ncbi:SPFH domain-containing protein [Paraburkholderia tropica]|uniref:hypothetical protein n=1 Tax=Paraburkholderia tropica TaxID=92647 RepID=UPI000F54FB83|nr:hypothetical protein [Paraburkholderia tropica]RQN41009.1 hypothetical protein EHZ25_01860 [Paraburkholderia tropica]
MEQVADSLARQAIASLDADGANLFGRSAFNRYYYGVYLAVRAMLQVGHPEIQRFQHKDLPDELTGKVRNRIMEASRQQIKRKLLDEGHAAQLIDSATTALRELAEILREGYRIRVVADYDPSAKAIVQNGHVLLQDKTTDAARQWGRRAERAIGQVKRVWRQLGITH